MTVVSAFLVPGCPLHLLRPDNPPWRPIIAGFERAARALAMSRPDAVLLYSTQWIAVLDALWQARPRLTGIHVDESWHDYGDMPFDIRIDAELAHGCVAACHAAGISAKSVDYDQFPIDSGTIVATRLLDPEGRFPLVMSANNLYHDAATTMRMAEIAAATAHAQNKKVAVVGVGGLSGTAFREPIAIEQDRVASDDDDGWNRRMLRLLEKGETGALDEALESYAQEARVDMGFKHLAWIRGAVGGRFFGARVHGYGPAHGAGAAVVEFRL